MKKLLLVAIIVLTLSGCNFGGTTPAEYEFDLFDGQDTVEINSEWIDAGAVMYFDSDPVSPVVSGSVNNSVLGLYKISYRYTHEEIEYIIERYVIVVDTIEPVITLTAGLDTIILGTEWVDAGVTILDNSLETLSYTVIGSVDFNTVGRYVITYSVTDSSGNNSSIDRVVNVVS